MPCIKRPPALVPALIYACARDNRSFHPHGTAFGSFELTRSRFCVGSDGHTIRIGSVPVVGVPVVVDVHGIRGIARSDRTSPPVATAAIYSDYPVFNYCFFLFPDVITRSWSFRYVTELICLSSICRMSFIELAVTEGIQFCSLVSLRSNCLHALKQSLQ